jgi:hypothetical protein
MSFSARATEKLGAQGRRVFGGSICRSRALLLALREQMALPEERPNDDYDPQDRSLASTMRALRRSMRRLTKYCDPTDSVFQQLSQAKVLRYTNHTDKRARYRPQNPDKKPLGEPTVRKLNTQERETLRKHSQRIAA